MIFIDTGPFLAKYIKNDQYHSLAVEKWKMVKKENKVFTSNHVIDEAITLLSRKTDFYFAFEKAKRIYSTDRFTILRTDLEDELRALKYFKKYSDQKVSFTDCLSMSLIERYRIDKIFTFDRHFSYLNTTII